MQYTPLAKLYYKDKSQYEEIYNERFHSQNAVHLDFQIGKYPLFFLQTHDLFRSIIEIQRIDKQNLSLIRNLPLVALRQFKQRCLIDELVITNNIEGVHSTRREFEAVLEKLNTDQQITRFSGLVNRYSALMQNNKIPLDTCEDIRSIYDEIVLPEVKKEDPKDIPDGVIFRKGPVSVTNEVQREIHRGLYPEEVIISAMEKALAVLKKTDIEPVFRMAIFHYLFGYIHPFYEGNGRTSRFITSYLLSQEFEPILGYRISYTIKEKISEYYKGFTICNDPKNKGDLTPFLYMFVDIIKKSAQQLQTALESRWEKLKYYEAAICQLPNQEKKQMESLYFLLIQAALFADDGISTSYLLKLLEISRSTLKKRLALISQEGLLICVSSPIGNQYRLDLDKVDQIIAAKQEKQP